MYNFHKKLVQTVDLEGESPRLTPVHDGNIPLQLKCCDTSAKETLFLLCAKELYILQIGEQ